MKTNDRRTSLRNNIRNKLHHIARTLYNNPQTIGEHHARNQLLNRTHPVLHRRTTATIGTLIFTAAIIGHQTVASGAYTNNNGSGSYPAFSTVVTAINNSAAQIGIANDAQVGTSTVGELPAIRGNTANQTGVLASTASINYHAFFDQNNQWSVFQQQYSQNPWWMMGNGMPYYATGTLNSPSTYQSVFINPNTGQSDFNFVPIYDNANGNQKGTEMSVFTDGNGNSLFYNALTDQSDFAYNPDAANTEIATQSDPTTWNEAIGYNNSWSVFADKYGASAFVQPMYNANGANQNGGLSYFAQRNETGLINNGTTYGLSSVFKDEYGGERSVSVFAGRDNALQAYEIAHSETPPVFGTWDSAFQTQAIAGNPEVPLGSSVFLTDDPYLTGPNGNPDIGHSVFLDPYGNSYLDDIAEELTWSGTNANPFQPGTYYQGSGLGVTGTQETYTSLSGDFINWNTLSNDSLNTSSPSLTLTDLIAYDAGTALMSGNNGIGLTSPYAFITSSAFQEAPGEQPAQWYAGPLTIQGSYTNMFAQAFFSLNQSTGDITPYLSAFSTWQDPNINDTATSNTVANAQNQNLQNAFNQGENFITGTGQDGTPIGIGQQTATFFNTYTNQTTQNWNELVLTPLDLSPIEQLTQELGGESVATTQPATSDSGSWNALYTPINMTQAETTQIQTLPEGGVTNQTAADQSPDLFGTTSGSAITATIMGSIMGNMVLGTQNLLVAAPWLAAFINGIFAAAVVVWNIKTIQWGLNGGRFPLQFGYDTGTALAQANAARSQAQAEKDVSDNIANIIGQQDAANQPEKEAIGLQNASYTPEEHTQREQSAFDALFK